MKIPFVDLQKQYQEIKPLIDERIAQVLTHGQFIGGPEIKQLETELSKFCGAKYSLACANGTDALQIALMSLDIKPGDEVITTPFTFFATGEVIALLGAKAVFVDIDPETYNINPDLIEEKITDKTKAIIPVSLYGLCPDLEKIQRIGSANNVHVIEDGAQSFGAITEKGNSSCSINDLSTTSFFPAKPLGCYGDGGAVFTNNEELANKVNSIRNHGQAQRYHHEYIGLNSRLDTIQAAILLEKIKLFPKEIELRNIIAKRYSESFSHKLKTQKIPSSAQCVFAQYTLEVSNRDSFLNNMKEAGIPVAVHYPICLQHQPIFKKLGYTNIHTPHAENASTKVVSIPVHPYLEENQQELIINKTLEFAKA